MRDLGRLARHVGNLAGVIDWVVLHATTMEEARRATHEVLAGHDEAGPPRQIPDKIVKPMRVFLKDEEDYRRIDETDREEWLNFVRGSY